MALEDDIKATEEKLDELKQEKEKLEQQVEEGKEAEKTLTGSTGYF